MSSSVESHLVDRVTSVPINPLPFPHFFVENVFPDDFYEQIQENLPDPAALISLEEARDAKGYKERLILELNSKHLAVLPEPKRIFWAQLKSWLAGGRFGSAMLDKFSAHIAERFKDTERITFYNEALLVQDVTNYQLGPHTDAMRKVITFLFYLPRDRSQSHLGTSIYRPRKAGFKCRGGPHYPRHEFECVSTMPFIPNSLFVFFKNDVSFHGVEPVEDPDTRRWLLLYDIYARKLPENTKRASSKPAAS